MNLRKGFTLMEVALATLVLVVSCLVVLMLLPNALRVQKMSRYKVVASLHAQNLMARFYQSSLDTTDVQAYMPFQDDSISRGYGDVQYAGVTLGEDTAEGCYNLIKRNKMLSLAGEYDFERQIANAFNNTYPVPLAIARRLDSPNDEIKKLLDAGGAVYYSDKLNSGTNPHVSTSGAVNSDLQQLIFGVVGAPQQNMLPYNPMNNIHVELYPHPPQGHPRPTDRVYTGENTYVWGRRDTTQEDDLGRELVDENGNTITGPFTVEHWYQTRSDGQRYPRSAIGWFGTRSVGDDAPFHPIDNNNGTSGNRDATDYQTHNWEYYAYKYRDDATHPDRAWFDTQHSWSDLTGLAEPYHRWPESTYTTVQAYRDLVQQHWLRIVHQIDPVALNVDGGDGPGGGPVMQWHWVTHYRPVLDANNSTQRDAFGRVIMEEYQVREPYSTGLRARDEDDDGEFDNNDTVIRTYGDFPENDGFYPSRRGFPHPATGMGYSLLGGTDIAYEDAFAATATAMEQVRVSMPSLERRVKYRTQALILWARAAYGKDIRRVEDPTRAYVAAADGTAPAVPAGSGRTYLEEGENPLYHWQELDGFLDKDGEVLSTSGDRATGRIHPTQVLALNYLAHAAAMVTGYRPPFVDRKQTLEARDDSLMVPDGIDPETGAAYKDLPYMASRNSMLLDIETVADIHDPAGSSAGLDAATGRWLLQPALVKMGAGQWGVQVRCTDDVLRVCEVDLETGELQLTDSSGTFAAGQLHADLRDPDGTVRDASGAVTDSPVVVNVDEHFWLRNPYHRDNFYVDNFGEEGAPAYEVQTSELLEKADPKILQTYRHVDSAGTTFLAYDATAATAEPIGDGTHVPIGFRRHEGEVLNPFPPPYADLGAFDAGGNPRYKVTWQLHAVWVDDDDDGTLDRPVYRLLRKLCHDRDDVNTFAYDDALAEQDTQWMRRSHEAMMRVMMYYVSDNPYDTTVPKPANRQVFTDRGIWQYDLFNDSGQAIRPADFTSETLNRLAFYRVNAPYQASARGDDFRFSVNWCNPNSLDSLIDYGEPTRWDTYYTHAGIGTGSGGGGSTCWQIGQRAAPRSTGWGLRLGQPYPVVREEYDGIFERSDYSNADRGAWDEFKYSLPDSYINYVNELHGNEALAFNSTDGIPAVPPAETARPGHFLATQAFSAEERTRQLVYWQVDWMQYADFESAPSAPVDWSRMNYQKTSSIVYGDLQTTKTRGGVMGPTDDDDVPNGVRMPGDTGRCARWLQAGQRQPWENWRIVTEETLQCEVGDTISFSPTREPGYSYEGKVIAVDGEKIDFDWIIRYDNNGDEVVDNDEYLLQAGSYLNDLPHKDKEALNLADMSGTRPLGENTTDLACADSFVMENNADTNMGSSDVKYLKNESGNQCWLFVKFYLTARDGEENAKVRIKINAADKIDPNRFGVFSVEDDSWDEYGITWNTMPAVGGQIGSLPNATGKRKTGYADVTDQVNAATQAGESHISFCIQPIGAEGYVKKTYAKEEATKEPALIFTPYGDPGWNPNDLDPDAEVQLVDEYGSDTISLTAWQFDPVLISMFDWAPNHAADTDLTAISGGWDPVQGGDGEHVYFWRKPGGNGGYVNSNNWKMNTNEDDYNRVQIINWRGTVAYLADSDYFSGNPERDFAFLDPERTATVKRVDENRITGDFRWIIDSSGGEPMIHAGGHTACPAMVYNPDNTATGNHFDRGWSADAPYYNAFMQTGYFGADRNRDGQYSVGDVPAGTHMQALEVARFNFYDPVCWVRFGQ